MSDEEWGPWIEHDQKHVPQAVLGQLIEINSVGRSGNPLPASIGVMPMELPPNAALCFLGGGFLPSGGWAAAVIRYRIRKSRTQAAVEALKAIAADPKRKFRKLVKA